MAERNYTVGRGEVHFARFRPGTQIPTGFRYIGNTPEFSLTLESETLDHYNSDRGIREKDASVTIEVTRSGTIVADEILAENIAMFLFGAVDTVSTAGGTSTETIPNVIPGRSYPLGVTEADPVGALMVAFPGEDATAFTVTSSGGSPTTYDAGTDYVFNPASGLLTIVEGGAIAADSDIVVNYTELAYSHERIVSGAEPVTGALTFITYNPIGKQYRWTFPSITIRPNGDYNLKGDEWQQIPYAFEILRKGNLEGVYVNGAPFIPE
jgi:hypothetical protein